jgi:hypothetical protein
MCSEIICSDDPASVLMAGPVCCARQPSDRAAEERKDRGIGSGRLPQAVLPGGVAGRSTVIAKSRAERATGLRD